MICCLTIGPDPPVSPARAAAEETAAGGPSLRRKLITRSLMLGVTGVSLYLLAPSLLQVFSSWPKLRQIDPVWIVPALVFEVCSYIALWTLQRVALRTRSWFAIGTSQLAAGAAGSIIPGGGATATAIQYGILVRSGIPSGRVASGLAASWATTTATVFALPVVAALAAIGGTQAPKGLRQVTYVGAGAFAFLAVVGATAFLWDRPLRLAGCAARWAAGLIGKRERFEHLPEHMIEHRDGVRSAVAERPLTALVGAIGKWGFDYLTLVCVLAALGVRPDPALVLLAYASAQILAMIPLTPGGLGFVEAGLAGLLVLAGVPGGAAAVATLAYRLIGFWLPMPAGLVAYWLARRRYGSLPSPAATASSTSDAISSPP
jgi:uncharacterized protein (TIRG00374 family)